MMHNNYGDYMYYINCFFIYSIFGFLLETVISHITNSNFKSGVFYGPFTPIYGIGAVVILFISNYLFKNLHMNRVYETVIMFFVTLVCLSTIEVLSGLLIEKFFGITFWNYSNHKYPIGKYISFEMALTWGFISIIFVYLIHPVLKNIIKKIPSFITIILIFLAILDIVKTFIDKKN